MRRLLALSLVSALALAALAAEEPKANTLTAKEAAEGWLQLFDGETTFGWTSPNGSQWTVFNGMLAPQAGTPGLLVTTSRFGDFDLKMEYRARRDSEAKLRVGCQADGTFVPGHQSEHMLRTFGDSWVELSVQVKGGVWTRVEGRTLSGVSGVGFATKSTEVKPPPRPVAGHIALVGNGMVVRNIRLKPLATGSLFNGKDLTGWKVFPGKKAEFAVVDGAISVKNGPGDLQSEGQWDNFILQLDCKTNGPRLNSGVFFRCIPGQYQNGYEAQIHNGWLAEGTAKEYTVEEYDPRTHEFTGKKTVKSAAADYGTGAIYRRIPARKQAAQDNEWFTLTVLADGRHIATWVNGVQTVDWMDERPLKENPRQGCRLEKGPISLQAHDPTTDLLFRNFRLQELKSAAAPPKPDEKK
jgi:hypothetical protein